MHDIRLNGKRHSAPTGINTDSVTLIEAPQGEYDLPLKGLLQAIRRNLWLVVLVVMLCGGLGVGFGLIQTPTYVASSKVLVGLTAGQGYGERGTSGDLMNEVQGLQQFSKNVAALSNSSPMANTVAERLDSDVTSEDLQANMNVKQIADTPALEIEYRDASPERAMEVDNAIAEVLSEQIPGMSPGDNAVTARVWEEATLPQVRDSPNIKNYALWGLALGGLLGIGLALLLERLDERWRSLEEVEQVSGYPTLCAIPTFSVSKARASKKRKGED